MTLEEIKNRLMSMEATDFGWDVRDEMLALVEIAEQQEQRLAAVERRAERLAEGTGDYKHER